jgi:hypothetical protein
VRSDDARPEAAGHVQPVDALFEKCVAAGQLLVVTPIVSRLEPVRMVLKCANTISPITSLGNSLRAVEPRAACSDRSRQSARRAALDFAPPAPRDSRPSSERPASPPARVSCRERLQGEIKVEIRRHRYDNGIDLGIGQRRP